MAPQPEKVKPVPAVDINILPGSTWKIIRSTVRNYNQDNTPAEDIREQNMGPSGFIVKFEINGTMSNTNMIPYLFYGGNWKNTTWAQIDTTHFNILSKSDYARFGYNLHALRLDSSQFIFETGIIKYTHVESEPDPAGSADEFNLVSKEYYGNQVFYCVR
jgi:hypothetical protein